VGKPVFLIDDQNNTSSFMVVADGHITVWANSYFVVGVILLWRRQLHPILVFAAASASP
jgi:hypothetical protein